MIRVGHNGPRIACVRIRDMVEKPKGRKPFHLAITGYVLAEIFDLHYTGGARVRRGNTNDQMAQRFFAAGDLRLSFEGQRYDAGDKLAPERDGRVCVAAGRVGRSVPGVFEDSNLRSRLRCSCSLRPVNNATARFFASHSESYPVLAKRLESSAGLPSGLGISDNSARSESAGTRPQSIELYAFI